MNSWEAMLVPYILGRQNVDNRPLHNIKIEPQGLTVEILYIQADFLVI